VCNYPDTFSKVNYILVNQHFIEGVKVTFPLAILRPLKPEAGCIIKFWSSGPDLQGLGTSGFVIYLFSVH